MIAVGVMLLTPAFRNLDSSLEEASLTSGAGSLETVLRIVVPIRLSVADEIDGADITQHGEEAYYGGDVGALAGRRVAIADSVQLPAEEMARLESARRSAEHPGPRP